MTLYSSMKCCGGRGDGDARNPFSHDDHGWAEYESRMISALAAGVAGGFANRDGGAFLPDFSHYYTVETAYKVYVCPRGNLLYMQIYLIADLKLL